MAKKKIKYITVSMADIIQNPLYEDFKDYKNCLKAMLYSMGLNINKHYEENFCTHRAPISQKVVTCSQYTGEERTDDLWVSRMGNH